MALLGPGIRRAFFGGPSSFFVCSQCLRQPPRRPPSSRLLDIVGRRWRAAASPAAAPPARFFAQTASPILSRTSDAGRAGFPPVTSKSVAYWLLGSAASVFGIVVFGGLTRLTESG